MLHLRRASTASLARRDDLQVRLGGRLRESMEAARRKDQGRIYGGGEVMIRFVKGERLTKITRGDRIRCNICGKRRAAALDNLATCRPCRREAVRGYQASFRVSAHCGTCQ